MSQERTRNPIELVQTDRATIDSFDIQLLCTRLKQTSMIISQDEYLLFKCVVYVT